jgi:tetratricopeptide (TPR) repeat protein
MPTPPPVTVTAPTAPLPGTDLTRGTREVMLTGRLVLPDGLPPDEMIPTTLDCPWTSANLRSREDRRTMSDTQGEFRFRLEVGFGATQDFETMNKYSSCSIVVSMPGFEIVRFNLEMLDLRMGADVGQLVLKPLGLSEASIVSMNSLSAPEAARKELIKGRRELAGGHLDAARKNFEKAIARYPAYATAWFDLGKLQSRNGETDKALDSFRRAIDADPKYLGPRIQSSLLAATALLWEVAEAQSAAVLKMAPQGYPGMYLVHAIACFNLKKMDDAEKSARAGLQQDTARQFPKLANILGSVLEQRGDRTGAAEALRLYLERAPQAPDAERVRARLQALLK